MAHCQHWDRVRSILEAQGAITFLTDHGNRLEVVQVDGSQPDNMRCAEFDIAADNTIATRPVREWLNSGL